MDYYSGVHLTHGYRFNISSRLFDARSYTVDRETGLLDLDALRALRPHLRVGHGRPPRSVDVPGAAVGDLGGEHYSARMFCDIAMPDGSPSWADPRHVLGRALSKAGEAGFTCYVRPEIEFYLLTRPAVGRVRAHARRPGRLFRPGQPRRGAAFSGATPSRRWSRWGSRSSSAATRAVPGSRRSTCATRTR